MRWIYCHLIRRMGTVLVPGMTTAGQGRPTSLRKILTILALAGVLSVPASAIFGLGDIVFDPTNFAKAVDQLVELERQYKQLVETYRMVRSQYEHLRWMSQQVPVQMSTRYRSLAAPWKRVSASDAYGTTGAWIAGVNTGVGIPAGYAAATERLVAYGAALSKLPDGHRPRVKTVYGTIELTDGVNQQAMETLGRMRGAAAVVDAAIRNLEIDSHSGNPAMNTEMAVLNKINAAHMIAIRSAQDANQLLVSLTEQQILAAKRERDAEARAVEQHVRFLNEGQAVMAAQASGASEAMRRWRMP